MRLRRRHIVDVVGIERRLVKEGLVIMIRLTSRGREEGEVGVSHVLREEVVLSLWIEGQSRVGARDGHLLLVEASTGIE